MPIGIVPPKGAIPRKEKKHGHDEREKRNQEVGENDKGKGVAAS